MTTWGKYIEELRRIGKLSPTETMTPWTCCGGIKVDKSKRCPICGDQYEEE